MALFLSSCLEMEDMIEEKRELPMEVAIRYLVVLGLGALACACLI